MFWTDELIKSLDKKKTHLVDDAWSTSGFAHIGSLRGAVIHQIAYNAIRKAGLKGDYTFIMDDFVPMDGMPAYLDAKKYDEHMGKPLFTIPSPEKGKSLAEYFADDFLVTLENVNVKPKILWASNLYKEGKLNTEIKTALDSAEKIRKIYRKISGSERAENWYPFNPVCENCGKVGSTQVYDWDGDLVSYKCVPEAVDWAKGCGHEGKVSPLNGTGSLPWRVEWPARWKALGITVEGEGKDHWSAGGSREMADILAKEIFNYDPPYDLKYDFFLIGGKKMSSSAGRGITARAMSELLPVPVLNYLLASNPRKTIEFDPKGDTIPRLFDQYDGAREAYFGRVEFPDQATAFESSQTVKPQDGYVMRFSKVAYGIQMQRSSVYDLAEEEKGKKLNEAEKTDLEERIKYAQKWLKDFAPEDYIFEVKDNLPEITLSKEQKEFLSKLSESFKNIKWKGPEIHAEIHSLRKKIETDPKTAFSAIYLIFLGKDSGPQAGWLLSSMEKDFVLKRLEEAINSNVKKLKTTENINILKDNKIFYFDSRVKEKFPDLKVGLAIIKGVSVKKNLQDLETLKVKEMKEIYDSAADTVLSEIPELAEYRRIYKATGVDPTKRMPSPYALLKRVQQGKEIYNINTVVDSYNLVVMKQRTSAGAFNLEKIKFPVTLTFSKKGDTYLPLLAQEKEEIGEGELTWEDAKGTVICRSLNYRDSEETKVDEKTKDLIIYVDGTAATSPEKVQEVLDNVVNLITKYAGGTVELKGVYL